MKKLLTFMIWMCTLTAMAQTFIFTDVHAYNMESDSYEELTDVIMIKIENNYVQIKSLNGECSFIAESIVKCDTLTTYRHEDGVFYLTNRNNKYTCKVVDIRNFPYVYNLKNGFYVNSNLSSGDSNFLHGSLHRD